MVLLRQYYQSSTCRRYGPDWLVVLALLVVFFGVVDPAEPFYRQFKLSDSNLQHPFAYQERVTDNQLYVLSGVVPTLAIVVGHYLLKAIARTRSAAASAASNKVSITSGLNWYHSLHLSLLGLWISLALNGVVTDILKNLIGQPRPDFVARCGDVVVNPKHADKLHDMFLDVTSCTAPLGRQILIDGMKSTPSGHSSIAFSGLFYLSLWLVGQVHNWQWGRVVPVGWYLVASMPTLLALYVALSRTQDYRHHFLDVVLGSSIGFVVASVSYVRYHCKIREAVN